ncbi:MAG: hypothetical protein DMG40_26905 [Acidobacteria bacterium]|nr:MAG: hypothetical protein DMG40_26905 [Acidobacteriota bacterium]
MPGTLATHRTLVKQIDFLGEFLNHVPIRRFFEKKFPAPVMVVNLAGAKAIAERTLGAAAMADDMIYLEYGRTGIGAGIISGGKLMHGATHAAGELGHTHMIEEGPACKCGSFCCLQAIAGAAAIQTRIRKAIADGGGSELLALAGGDPPNVSGWMILSAAKVGDKACAAIVEQASKSFGVRPSQSGESLQSFGSRSGSAPFSLQGKVC